MELEKIHTEWLSSIDLTKTRITRSPSLIFLCGGEISKNGKGFKSCRDIFYRYILGKDSAFKDKVVLAEEVFRYFKHSDYKDLLSFESDIAHLASLTVVFTESPGSIAELGSFSVLETIQNRLLVVIHSDESEKESFIWQGPIKHLQNIADSSGKSDPIYAYRWRKRTNCDDLLELKDFADAVDLEETIEKMISELPRTESLVKNELGHIMLLMLDLLDVYGIATLSEITLSLNHLDIKHDQKTVSQHLSLLTSLNLSKKIRYSHMDFFFPAQNRSWLSWGFAKKARIRNVDRWKLRFTDYYENNNTQKKRALISHLKAEGLIGD